MCRGMFNEICPRRYNNNQGLQCILWLFFLFYLTRIKTSHTIDQLSFYSNQGNVGNYFVNYSEFDTAIKKFYSQIHFFSWIPKY